MNKWIAPGVICLIALSVFGYSLSLVAADGGPRAIGSGSGSGFGHNSGGGIIDDSLLIDIGDTELAPDCPLPVPAPACTTNGQTVCSEDGAVPGVKCQATVYTCACTTATPPVCTLGTPTQCTQNACTGNPGSVGSECQS